MVVIRLACPCVIGAGTNIYGGETRSAYTWFGQDNGEHAIGNGDSDLDLLPTFVAKTKVGPGVQGVETTPL